MLPLDSVRWSSLNHAYGSAADIPKLLRQLESLPPCVAYGDEPYFSLWSALCHQGDVYTASFAAVPRVVNAISHDPQHAPLTLLQIVTCIEIARSQKNGPDVPPDLLADYSESLAQIPDLVARAAKANWNDIYCPVALAAVAAAKGFCSLAEALLELDPPSINDFLRRKFEE
jgi:hypothetical protein